MHENSYKVTLTSQQNNFFLPLFFMIHSHSFRKLTLSTWANLQQCLHETYFKLTLAWSKNITIKYFMMLLKCHLQISFECLHGFKIWYGKKNLKHQDLKSQEYHISNYWMTEVRIFMNPFCSSVLISLREKCLNPKLFLVRIFSHSNWIQRNLQSTSRTRKNSEFENFPRSVYFLIFSILYWKVLK